VPARALLARSGLALLVLAGGVLAAVGGVSLGFSGLVAVLLAAVVAACVGAGIARETGGPPSRQAAMNAIWRTAAGTVGLLLVLTGSVVVAGGALTVLLAGCVVGVLLVRWAMRSARCRRAPIAPVVPLYGADGSWARRLSVPALGQEWLRTSAALPRTQGTSARQELVRRRQEALDELERRDPAGFARWLAGGATVDSDPAEYVSGDPAAGSDAA